MCYTWSVSDMILILQVGMVLVLTQHYGSPECSVRKIVLGDVMDEAFAVVFIRLSLQIQGCVVNYGAVMTSKGVLSCNGL